MRFGSDCTITARDNGDLSPLSLRLDVTDLAAVMRRKMAEAPAPVAPRAIPFEAGPALAFSCAAGWTLHGTPWSGHPEHASPSAGRLETIGFLRKGVPAAVRLLSPGEFVRGLMARVFVPWWLPDAGARCIQTARKVASQVEGRLVTLPATPAAAQFVVRAFAGRQSEVQTDSAR